MDQVPGLIERYFPSSKEELRIGDVPISTLADHYGTPFFVYDGGIIDQKWRLLRDALPDVFSVCYSVKANPNQTILKHFLSKGAGLEIASAGEFCQALHAGCPSENIIFAGPGKTEKELELVLGQGIGEIHLESLREAERVSAIAQKQSIRARVALRVNPGGEAEGGAMRMGGRPAAFGVDEETLEDVLDRLLALNGLDFRGIHIFAGTQILDYQILVSQYRKGLEIALRVATHFGSPLHTVDFGGGLGIPYFSHESALDTQKLKQELAVLFKGVQDEPRLSGTHFLIEPGRYLVGECGVYVARVSDVKISRGKKFLILDGGMHHHLSASGNLGQTIKRNYPVAVLNKLNAPAEETFEVAGPLCTPLDVLARNASLPRTDVGDLVGVFQSGAYARSASPLGFLSHATPPEIWVDGSNHHLIRRRGEFADYLRDQISDSGAAQPRK
ncbi:MAG: type III PLP-dependent enzyme [Candidatus Acidiferrum sp.]